MTSMQEYPKFSIIIPVHNKGPHVRRSISSALAQSFRNFELIVINDASTDNSLQEIKKFDDPRIILLHREIPGPGGYAARNLGIKEAKAEWVAFLDADDEWMPEHLEKMNVLAEKFPECSFLSCGWKNVISESNEYLDKHFQDNFSKGSHVITFGEYLRLCLNEKRPTFTGVACIRKCDLAMNLFPAGKASRGGDLYAWAKYLAHKKRMAWSPHIGAIYYRDSVNMVTKTTPHSPDLLIKIVKELSGLLNKEEIFLLKKYCNRRIWRAWIRHKMINDSRFSLHLNIFWSGDIFFCLTRSPFVFIPSGVLVFIRDFKNYVKGLSDKKNEYRNY